MWRRFVKCGESLRNAKYVLRIWRWFKECGNSSNNVHTNINLIEILEINKIRLFYVEKKNICATKQNCNI